SQLAWNHHGSELFAATIRGDILRWWVDRGGRLRDTPQVWSPLARGGDVSALAMNWSGTVLFCAYKSGVEGLLVLDQATLMEMGDRVAGRSLSDEEREDSLPARPDPAR